MPKDCLIVITGDPVDAVREKRGGFAELLLAASGLVAERVVVVDVRDGSALPRPERFRAVVVSGSAAMLDERKPWMLRGVEYLREVVEKDVPTLGVCFGHQMLAEALGGVVGRNPAGREIGSVRLSVEQASALLEPGEYWVNTTHLDSVLRLPPGAVALAQTKQEPNALVRFAPTAWGVQFHPELDREAMVSYISARADALRAEGAEPERLTELARETSEEAQVVANFFSRVVDVGTGVR